MPGLSDFLLDPRGQLRNAVQSAPPPRPPGNIPLPGVSLAGVNPRLVAAVQGGATYLPPGYRVEAVSGKEGRTDSRSHHSRGNAADFRIIGPEGPIPHQGEDTTGMYTHLARGVRTWALKNDPEIAGKIGYGGAFGTKLGGGGVPDLMHYDLGGSRGNMRPQVRFAMLQPLTSGEQRQAAPVVASAEPGAARPSMPPPSGQATRVRGSAISPSMAMQKLQSLGFNEAQSKAIVGNMVQESSLRPGAVTTKEGAHGLMQWRGDRFTALQQFAKGAGTDWRDANTQMEFIAHEMKNNPYEAKQAQRFMAANTVEEANAGMKGYLRYGDNSDGKRLRYAQEIPGSTGGAMAQSIAGSPGAQAIEKAAPQVPGVPPTGLAYGPTGAAAAPPSTAPPPLVEPGPGVRDPRRLYGTPPAPAREPEPGDIQGRIDQQMQKMFGVPPPAPEPGDIQGRIDQQIDKMYGATAPPPAATPGPMSYLDGQPQAAAPTPAAQASPPVSPRAAPAPQRPPARASAQASLPAAASSPLIRMHGADGSDPMGRLIPGQAPQAAAPKPPPQGLAAAIAAAVPLPRPKPDMPGAAPEGGPLSTPDPLAAGATPLPAAAPPTQTASLGDSMATSIMNQPAIDPAQTSIVGKNPQAPNAWRGTAQPTPPAWPAQGTTAPAPAYAATFDAPQPGGSFAPQSALPWWMQQQQPGFTPQNYGAWGDIGGGNIFGGGW
jgi:hypothetical protein